MKERSGHQGHVAAIALAVAFLLSIALYVGGYFAARAGHLLVHRIDGSLAGPDFRPVGSTPQEYVFLPMIALESAVRSRIDPSWNW